MWVNLTVKLKKLDWLFLGSVGVLLLLSLLELYSLAPTLENGILLFKKQLFFILGGFALMLFFAFFDYRFFKENVWIVLTFFLFSVLLLGVLLVIGKSIRGAQSWFKFGIFGFEPVEMLKIALILILAKFFAIRHIEIFLPRHLISSFVYLLIPLVLVVLQPDLGSASILFLIWLGIIIIAGMKAKHLVAILLIVALIGCLGWGFLLKDYQKARLINYFNPNQDPWGQGYNIIQSLTAIGNGGFWGKGLGQGSVVQLGFLPARHTDFIFASLGEEMGLVGIIILLFAYLILFSRLLKIALSTRDNFGRLLTIGALILFISQCFINLGMNIGILPITGISLPLLSYGGSGMIFSLILLGLAMSVKVNN